MRVSRRTPVRWTIPAAAVAAAAALGASLLAAPADAATTASTASSTGSASAAASSSYPSYVLAPVSITSAKLAKRPPFLTNPITLRPKDGVGQLRLSTSRDYRIVLPTTRAWRNGKGLEIVGGRNVVVRGGTVDVGAGFRDASGVTVRRAAYLKGATGTVFIEGIKFVSTSSTLTEGIDVSLPGAVLALQNVRIGTRLVSSRYHADALQLWAGPRRLFVDGFVATSDYQGFFLLPQQRSSAWVGTYDLRRLWLRGTDAAYLMWRDGSFPVRTSEVYITGSRAYNGGLWPSRSAWPYVRLTKPSKTFAAKAGFGYVSPGYL